MKYGATVRDGALPEEASQLRIMYEFGKTPHVALKYCWSLYLYSRLEIAREHRRPRMHFVLIVIELGLYILFSYLPLDMTSCPD